MRTGTDAELQRLIDLANAGDEAARENLLQRLTDLDGVARKTLLQRIIDSALSEDGKAPDALLKLVIDLANQGDATAREVLFTLVWNRLRALSKKIFEKIFPDDDRLRRWQPSDDVRQEAMLRLLRALSDPKVKLKSVRHFFNLSAVQLRRALLDLAKHHFGPEGNGANHHTDAHGRAADDKGGVLLKQPDGAGELVSLESWGELHAKVEKLPKAQRVVLDLHIYHGLTLEQTASELGISLATVKRRWRYARLRLHKMVKANER